MASAPSSARMNRAPEKNPSRHAIAPPSITGIAAALSDGARIARIHSLIRPGALPPDRVSVAASVMAAESPSGQHALFAQPRDLVDAVAEQSRQHFVGVFADLGAGAVDGLKGAEAHGQAGHDTFAALAVLELDQHARRLKRRVSHKLVDPID